MTRKDYELIAAAIRAMPSFAPTLRRSQMDAARVLANCLADENPRFDRRRFAEAALSPLTVEQYADEVAEVFA